jgi:hypothetical protein
MRFSIRIEFLFVFGLAMFVFGLAWFVFGFVFPFSGFKAYLLTARW